MIPPPWLLLIWRYLKPALPYIAALLAVSAAYSWSYQRGVESQTSAINALNDRLTTARANAVSLDAALARENAATQAAAQAATDAQKAAGEALARAETADKAMASMRNKAGALAKVKQAGDCPSPLGDELSKSVWGKKL